ncbi:type I-E CRISPR-associated protein Cse1/CasA [Streptomyces olivoreticuli]
MNVADGAWLPVRPARGAEHADGVYGPPPPWLPGGLVGGYAQALSAAHLIDHIDVPYEATESVVMRNLVAMTMRVTGLDRARGQEWQRLRARVLAEGRFDAARVEAYFAAHRHRMRLFDDACPYRQVPALRDECKDWAPPGKLVYGLPSGNNHVWFDKRDQDTPLPAHVAVWSLEALLGVGAGGGCGTRKPTGHPARSKTAAGPYRNTVSYFVKGRTLFETLVLNCPSALPAGPGEDLAPWETGAIPDPLAPALAAPSGRVSLLTGRSRHAVLLDPAPDGRAVLRLKLTWAFDAAGDKMPPALDPFLMHTHSMDKDGREQIRPVPADPDRALWRNVDSLIAHARPSAHRAADPDKSGKGSKESAPVVTPQVFTDLSAGLGSGPAAAVLRAARVRALSCAADKADDVLWWSADSPCPLFRPVGDRTLVLPTVRAAHTDAENAFVLLDRATKQMTTAMCAGNRDRAVGMHWPADARRLFWDRAEVVFWQAVSAARDGQPYEPGRFLPVAVAAYDESTATATQSPRGIQAVARARIILTRRPKPSSGKAAA